LSCHGAVAPTSYPVDKQALPVSALRSVAFEEGLSHFELADEQTFAGLGPEGISETFPLQGARTLYGSTKLAAELLIAEYRNAYGLRAVIERCG
jgi:CDP-paratose 2-epimerase